MRYTRWGVRIVSWWWMRTLFFFVGSRWTRRVILDSHSSVSSEDSQSTTTWIRRTKYCNTHTSSFCLHHHETCCYTPPRPSGPCIGLYRCSCSADEHSVVCKWPKKLSSHWHCHWCRRRVLLATSTSPGCWWCRLQGRRFWYRWLDQEESRPGSHHGALGLAFLCNGT